MPCRGGCGLCLGASSSSRSQPPSGQPATGRMSRPPFRRSQQLSLPRRFHRRRLLPRRSSTNARRRPLPPRLRRKPRRHLRRRPCSRPQPRPPPRRPLPLARPRLRRSCRLLPLRSLPLLIRRRMQDSKRRRRPLSRRALAPPRLRPSLPRSLRLVQLRRSSSRHCRSPRQDGRRSKSQAYLRPRTSRS